MGLSVMVIGGGRKRLKRKLNQSKEMKKKWENACTCNDA